MRIRGQGLGPGFTMVHTRRSVILSVDGLELVFTFFCGACSAAASRDRRALPTIPADVLKRSRRAILPLRLNIAVFLSLHHLSLVPLAQEIRYCGKTSCEGRAASWVGWASARQSERNS